VQQQTVAGVFDQIQHPFEAGIAASVRVGHAGVFVSAAELGQAAQFVTVFGRTA
jgi:hypothetical protein